ncbi:hypothetical protein EMERY_51 [Brevibacillus phage Emery]|nr:hypothetical protein EMERY_51 [Brevibacillus phage Emery]
MLKRTRCANTYSLCNKLPPMGRSYGIL